ncbi:hypothetical protein, partial [Arsukibacterium ikkense]|uniref:hypothetical protein n=1 Tax=Arsukibacterium ikkense TaxID=336831 RepID=UPI001F3E3D23
DGVVAATLTLDALTLKAAARYASAGFACYIFLKLPLQVNKAHLTAPAKIAPAWLVNLKTQSKAQTNVLPRVAALPTQLAH